MKIPLQTIDEFTGDIEPDIDPWFQNRVIIAKENNVELSDVEFKWHGAVGETVIFVKGSFYGYASDIWNHYIG